MFSNTTPATSIDCHQCVWFLRAHSTLPCFEVTDRIIVICSSPSTTLFDLYKSPWDSEKKPEIGQQLKMSTRAKQQATVKKEGNWSRVLNMNVFMHILLVTAHIPHSCWHLDQTGVPLICWERWADSSSGAVHRTHSRGEQCCLLASPVFALLSAHLTDYPLTQAVLVNALCRAISLLDQCLYTHLALCCPPSACNCASVMTLWIC